MTPRLLTTAVVFTWALTMAVSAGGAQPESIAKLLDEGAALVEAGDADAAMERYRTAVERDPKSSKAWVKLAGLQVVKGQYRDSIDGFRRALAADPNNADAFSGLAIAYLHLGDYALARAALQEVIRLDPGKRRDAEQILEWLDNKSAPAGGIGRIH